MCLLCRHLSNISIRSVLTLENSFLSQNYFRNNNCNVYIEENILLKYYFDYKRNNLLLGGHSILTLYALTYKSFVDVEYSHINQAYT